MLFEGVSNWDPTKSFVMEIKLHNIVKVEDWYGNQNTIMRKLRRGKGRNPYTDSTIWFRLKIDVNGEEIFSNYPQDMNVPIQEFENLRDMTPEEREQLLQDKTMLTLRLDEYILPSILQKVYKTIKKNQVVELTTTRVTDKLHTNFASPFLD